MSIVIFLERILRLNSIIVMNSPIARNLKAKIVLGETIFIFCGVILTVEQPKLQKN